MSQNEMMEQIFNRAERAVATQPRWVKKAEEQACREKELEKRRPDYIYSDSKLMKNQTRLT